MVFVTERQKQDDHCVSLTCLTATKATCAVITSDTRGDRALDHVHQLFQMVVVISNQLVHLDLLHRRKIMAYVKQCSDL